MATASLAALALTLPAAPSPASSGVTVSTVALAPDDFQLRTSVVIGADSNPLVAYGGTLVHCNDPYCATHDEPVALNYGDVRAVSMAIGADGTPVIAFVDHDLLLTLFVRGLTRRVAWKVGFVALAIGSDGNPIAAYSVHTDGGEKYLRVTHCRDPQCDSIEHSTILDRVGVRDLSAAVGPDGNLVITFNAARGSVGGIEYQEDVLVARCADVACSSATSTPLDTEGWVGAGVSVAVTADSLPVASYVGSYFDEQNGNISQIRVGSCTSPACESGGAVSGAVDSGQSCNGQMGTGNECIGMWGTSLALDPSTGFPVVAYNDAHTASPSDYDLSGGLKLAACQQANCAGTNYVTTLLPIGNYCRWIGGWHGCMLPRPSLAISPAGRATIVFVDGSDQTIKVAVCEDATCGATQSAGSSSANASFGTPTTAALPGLPGVPGLRLATDLRYVLGSRVTDACNTATSGDWHCDILRDPKQYVPAP